VLLRAPDSWPQPVVAVVAMVILAVLDLGGAIAAKEAVERRSYALAIAGAALYLLLFWVYASSLKVAELGPVTFGWIVVLQIGVVLVDRFHYGTTMPTGKWVAVAVLVVAQAYLLLGPSGDPAVAAPDRPPAATAAGPVSGHRAGRHVAGPRPAHRHAAGVLPPGRVAAAARQGGVLAPAAGPGAGLAQIRIPAPRRPAAAPSPVRHPTVSVP
jgi:hypothetical protein